MWGRIVRGAAIIYICLVGAIFADFYVGLMQEDLARSGAIDPFTILLFGVGLILICIALLFAAVIRFPTRRSSTL